MWIDVENFVTGGLVYAVDEAGTLMHLLHETLLESVPRTMRATDRSTHRGALGAL
jgi:hypothetical protein